MDLNLKDIVNGWYNHLTNQNQEVASKRLNICLPCEFNSTPKELKISSTCNKCGCFLKAKAANKSSKCPIEKW